MNIYSFPPHDANGPTQQVVLSRITRFNSAGNGARLYLDTGESILVGMPISEVQTVLAAAGSVELDIINGRIADLYHQIRIIQCTVNPFLK